MIETGQNIDKKIKDEIIKKGGMTETSEMIAIEKIIKTEETTSATKGTLRKGVMTDVMTDAMIGVMINLIEEIIRIEGTENQKEEDMMMKTTDQ